MYRAVEVHPDNARFVIDVDIGRGEMLVARHDGTLYGIARRVRKRERACLVSLSGARELVGIAEPNVLSFVVSKV